LIFPARPPGRARRSYHSAAHSWTHTHLFDEILPAAREAGVTDEQIRVMLDDNPKAWLTA
jgi:predicted metal-dependent phosphotriesterase family hydrolase